MMGDIQVTWFAPVLCSVTITLFVWCWWSERAR